MAHETFTKESATTPEGYFQVEAAGLRWLALAGPGSAQVVRVRSVEEGRIELDNVPNSRPSKASAEAFGHALARTHAAGADAFGQGPDGWDGDGFIGVQAMTLRPEDTWGVFFAEQRILPYAQAAHALGNLNDAGMRTIERIAARLADGVFDDGSAPSRIHGDLWAGNVLWSPKGVVLIDPAAHGGHGLTDLAMLSLFGAPFIDVILDAYAESARLTEGWRGLIGLHQLHPLLVHAVTHSAAYGTQAVRLAERFL
ncbi:fructosamine kinase family protein [Raineyella fluvialis]|uniref:Phosphotransferase n=1 Tax=Raineyella fluvialis TaxID=2662261 RepID=A0A5Q2FDI7_9ACTN|nr:fructosamine kinase family protein [Raineyella fluvialis]QGF23857.1 phosphotransferase [Raineyella fluvialis]